MFGGDRGLRVASLFVFLLLGCLALALPQSRPEETDTFNDDVDTFNTTVEGPIYNEDGTSFILHDDADLTEEISTDSDLNKRRVTLLDFVGCSAEQKTDIETTWREMLKMSTKVNRRSIDFNERVSFANESSQGSVEEFSN